MMLLLIKDRKCFINVAYNDLFNADNFCSPSKAIALLFINTNSDPIPIGPGLGSAIVACPSAWS